MCIQPLCAVQAEPAGTGSRAVTGNYQRVHRAPQGLEALLWSGVGQGNRRPSIGQEEAAGSQAQGPGEGSPEHEWEAVGAQTAWSLE